MVGRYTCLLRLRRPPVSTRTDTLFPCTTPFRSEGSGPTVEEFFHTFNHLHQASLQIVLSSDRPPDAIGGIEDRLRSRFKMGLLTDIQPPDFETRLAILRNKAEREATWVPPEVLEIIADNITDNIRVLEGALIRVGAFANLTQIGRPHV